MSFWIIIIDYICIRLVLGVYFNLYLKCPAYDNMLRIKRILYFI